ncbi:MAG: Membrane protein [Bacteroidetes bacterium]|jgi:O-antigen/teichoic acid export membrane protein|nr:Membrane protein [Bacteroidota bacterium]
MLDKIKRLGSDTAVYGISTILGRFLTFLLTPLYTHVLSPEDLGVVATVYAYIAFLNVIYGYGMEGAYMKYVSTLELGNRKQVFTVPFLAIGVTSLVFSGVIAALAQPVAAVSGIPAGFANVVPMGAGILFLDALTIVPFAALRMSNRARLFATIKVAGIVVNVVSNVVMLFWFRMGVEGIFLSGLLSSGITLLMLIPVIVQSLDLSWPTGILPALLKFGLPSVPAGIAGMMLQVINRPILGALRGDAAVGIFQANYRLGIFMMLLVSMFDFAWRPFFLNHAKDPDARPLFARVMTYFVLCTTTVFLLLSFYLYDLIRWPIFAGRPLIAPRFWEGFEIVPVILLAYVFLGIYNNLIAGIYIEKKTARLPLVTITAALVHVAANFLLIPPLGLMGAAWSTLLSYLLMAGMMYVIVQRIYPVRYETARLAKIAVAAAVVYTISLFSGEGLLALLVKAGLMGLFVALLAVMRFFEPGEWAAARRLLRLARPGQKPPAES